MSSLPDFLHSFYTAQNWLTTLDPSLSLNNLSLIKGPKFLLWFLQTCTLLRVKLSTNPVSSCHQNWAYQERNTHHRIYKATSSLPAKVATSLVSLASEVKVSLLVSIYTCVSKSQIQHTLYPQVTPPSLPAIFLLSLPITSLRALWPSVIHGYNLKTVLDHFHSSSPSSPHFLISSNLLKLYLFN